MVAQNISHLLFPVSIGIAGLIHASVQLMNQKKATWTGVAMTGIAEFSSLDLSHVHMSHIRPWSASSGVVSEWPAHILRIITEKQERKQKCSNILWYLYKCQLVTVPLAKESHMIQLSVTVRQGSTSYRKKRYSLGLLMQLVYHSPQMCLWQTAKLYPTMIRISEAGLLWKEIFMLLQYIGEMTRISPWVTES